MSFSFSVTGATKAAARAAVEERFAGVVEAQPVHARDQATIVAAAAASIDTLVEPGEGQCVRVSVSGSLGWRAEGEFTSANVSIGAHVGPAD